MDAQGHAGWHWGGEEERQNGFQLFCSLGRTLDPCPQACIMPRYTGACLIDYVRRRYFLIRAPLEKEGKKREKATESAASVPCYAALQCRAAMHPNSRPQDLHRMRGKDSALVSIGENEAAIDLIATAELLLKGSVGWVDDDNDNDNEKHDGGGALKLAPTFDEKNGLRAKSAILLPWPPHHASSRLRKDHGLCLFWGRGGSETITMGGMVGGRVNWVVERRTAVISRCGVRTIVVEIMRKDCCSHHPNHQQLQPATYQ